MKKSMIPLRKFGYFQDKFNHALNLILPYRCLVSGEVIDGNTGLSAKAWSELTFISDPKCNICGIPFAFIEDFESDTSQQKCLKCIEEKPFYDKALATLIYNDASRPLILAYKHGDQTHMSVPFADWMERTGQEILRDVDALMPVPLHWSRFIKRRYNQASLIAQNIGAENNIPVLKSVLKRQKATISQGHLSSKDRHKNVKHAFIVEDKDKHLIEGKTICLIDDVFTSGATVNECAKVLKAAGSKTVYVLCLARVADI